MILICVMRNIIIIFLFLAVLSRTAYGQTKPRKIDTTATQGSASYHVMCNNKNESANDVFVSPKGFGKDIRDLSFSIKGRLRKILVDDLNADGYPDLILCIYSGAGELMGNIAGIVTKGNNAFEPVYFPDIYSNPKISQGYKGADEFSVMVGTLLQSFPVHNPTDTSAGVTRVVQYEITKGEKGNLAFQVLRSYEKKQQ
jgi:hypothetical protein